MGDQEQHPQVSLAEGLADPASRVGTVDELARDFDIALAVPGPHLIEVPF